MTKIYAHRGSKGHYPENSMLAFKRAIKAKVEGIEFDIHMTKDQELVVIHDATLDRTTTGSGFVKDHTLSQIKAFSIGEKYTEFKNYDPSWNLEVVPTLKEVLTLCLMHNVDVNIELKTYQVAYDQIEAAMLKVVDEVGYPLEKVIYSSFHLPTLLRLKKMRPDAKVAWLLEHFIPMPQDYLETLQLEALHMDKDIILKNPEYWQTIAKKLRVWTVNDESDMNQLLDMGIDALITDYPEIAIKQRPLKI